MNRIEAGGWTMDAIRRHTSGALLVMLLAVPGWSEQAAADDEVTMEVVDDADADERDYVDDIDLPESASRARMDGRSASQRPVKRETPANRAATPATRLVLARGAATARPTGVPSRCSSTAPAARCRSWAIVLLAAALLAGPACAHAASSPAENFDRGVAAARAGNHDRAIEHFEAARRAGLDSGALHFNLGVSYYRAGRLEEAESAFRRAANSDAMVAPAHYQLGRLARQRGDRAAAREHFRQAARRAQTNALRQRARGALRAVASVAPPRVAYLGVGAGHDSNLALTPSEASGTSEQSDAFVDGVLVGRWPLEDRFYLRASTYVQKYLEEDDFDLLALRAGLGRVGSLAGGWRWDAWIDGRYQAFGGDAFENALLAGGRLQRPLSTRWSVELDYRFELARGASGFGFLDGYEHRVSAALDERGREGWNLFVGAGTSDRDDRTTADDFFSFSWSEFRLQAEKTHRLDDDHWLAVAADWRRRRYDGSEIRDGARLGSREDDLFGVEAELERRLDRDWRATLSLRLERRDSTIAEFDYDREIIRVGFDRTF